MELVRDRKGGMVQAGQAKRNQVALAVLAGLAVLADPTHSPEYLPESTLLFNETFIRGHRHFLTQTYSHPETYSQGEATNLQSGRTQMITTSANVFQTAMTMQRKSPGLFTAFAEGAPTCVDAGTSRSYKSVSPSDAPPRFLFHNISMTFR